MPLRGLIGSDILKYRDDWKVIDSPFGRFQRPDRVAAARSSPTSRCFTRRWRTGTAMSGSGASVSLQPWPMPRRRPIVTVEKIYDGDLMDDPTLAAGSPARLLRRTGRGCGAWRVAAGTARPLRARSGASHRVRAHGGDRRKALPIISSVTSMPAAPRDFRDEELLADVITRLIGDVRHIAVGNASPIPATAALLARERGERNALRFAARQPQAHILDRRRARAVRLRRPGPHRRVLPLGRPDRRPRQRQPGLDRRLRASQGALPGLVWLRPSLLRGAEGDPVPHSSIRAARSCPKWISSARRAQATPNVYRPGGPVALITNRCLFSFARWAVHA